MPCQRFGQLFECLLADVGVVVWLVGANLHTVYRRLLVDALPVAVLNVGLAAGRIPRFMLLV